MYTEVPHIMVTSCEFDTGMFGEQARTFCVQVASVSRDRGVTVHRTSSCIEEAYDMMRECYPYVVGRKERIKYWHFMKAMSPKGRDEYAREQFEYARARAI